MEKDMKTVADYNREEKLKFLRGMAFNNASLLLASRKYENVTLTAENVFDLAERLFDEAIKRDYLNYGKVQDNRIIDKATGKIVEVGASAVGGVPVTLTSEDVDKMDIGENEVVI